MMRKKNIRTIIGVTLSLAIAIGGWFLTSNLIENKLDKLIPITLHVATNTLDNTPADMTSIIPNNTEDDFTPAQSDLYENEIVSSVRSQESQMYNLLFSLDREMDGYIAQLEKYNINLENLVIRAPVNGYVNMLSVVSAGQTVTPGNNVVSIVPSDSVMQFECYISDKDRAEIDLGMEVTIKLSAFSFSDYGVITGNVTYISPSAFVNEKYGNVYVVNIDFNEDTMNTKIKLTPGISGNVEIVVGKRTVLWYFLDPIMGNLRDSLKEN